jgi:tRNA (pseudouridine54-N1)-methyltransferase
LREFILYSRKGRTDSKFRSLREAGRLDVVQECIVASLFLSHGIRRNVVFHATLYGPPSPPLHLRIDGGTLRDVRTDQRTWEEILRKVLSGGMHAGISTGRQSFEALLKEKTEIYVLEEGGRSISEMRFGEHVVFVLGDHVGLPKKVEGFALRYGQKVSLGRKKYLAASCITILNYLLDRKALI